MAKPPCIFYRHCGGASGTWEHVFPAALGGLRGDTRILCDACQSFFGSDLDDVLPKELRHFNTLRGVVSRHRDVVPRSPVADLETGQQLLLDEKQRIASAVPALVRTSVDDRGMQQREYKVIGDLKKLAAFDERLFLRQLQAAEGKTFEVMDREAPREVLIARPLHGDGSFGGSKTFRAVARVALNHLAAENPTLARSEGLEPLKSWITEVSKATS